MDSKEFLKNILSKLDDGNTEINNFGFKEITSYLNLFNNFKKDKTIFCMSFNAFHNHIDNIFSNKYMNSLESIISLPIFNDDDNLIILIFNSKKTDDKCLFIDESDSLVHKNDSVDWTYANEELIGKITKTYDEFTENDTSIIVDVEDMFQSIPNKDELIFKSNKIDSSDNKSFADELLSLKNDIETVSVRKHRVISDEVADGLLLLKEEKSVKDEISRHNIKSMETPQNNKFLFLNDSMYYKKRQNPENLLYKDGKPLIDGEVKFRKLGKIADLHNIYVKNNLDSILIATCKGCKSKLVFYNKDITDLAGEVYIELINVDETVSKDYLYEYLNSSNGFNDLLYFSKGTNFINPNDIKNVKIPIPPLDVQKEIVNVSRESREFFKTIDLLKKEYSSNIFDYKHMRNSIDGFNGSMEFNEDNEIATLSRSWRHAYKGLIWPLAISYLSATKGGFESVEKKDNYLVLFEFIAAFNTVVLLSGLPEDVYQKNFSRIWNSRNPNEYKQMTFANWVYASKNLAKVYRYNNFISQLDEKLFDKIASDKMLDILEDAKNLRNEESHGSHSNSYEAEQVIEKLEIYLEDIFDILEEYSDYKLIYVTGDYSSAKNGYDHRIILLNGPCAQPIYDNIIFDVPLQSESLYLYNPKNNKKLLLKDSLIKFRPVDENKKRWALFIYYSCDRNEYNAKYKCFQSKEKDIERSISSLNHDILGKNFH